MIWQTNKNKKEQQNLNPIRMRIEGPQIILFVTIPDQKASRPYHPKKSACSVFLNSVCYIFDNVKAT